MLLCVQCSLPLLFGGVPCTSCYGPYTPQQGLCWLTPVWAHCCCCWPHAGTTLRYRPGVIVCGGGLVHDCGTSRAMGWFLEPLVVLGLWAKKVRQGGPVCGQYIENRAWGCGPRR